MFTRIRKVMAAAMAVCLTLIMLMGCSAQKSDEPKSTVVKPSPYAKKLELLNQTADELFRQSEAGTYAEARLKLIQFGDLMNSIPFHGITSVEGAHELSEAVVEAKRTFNAASISPPKALKASSQIRLAADAITHSHQPMWLQYYKVMKDHAKALENAAVSRKTLEMRSALSAFEERYEIIRPAVWISREPWQGEKMDSLLAFLDNQAEAKDVSFDNLTAGTKQLQDAIDELFGKKEERTAYVPIMNPGNPIQWSLTIGSLIIAVLSYVAWRMFQGDRMFARIPRNDDLH